MESTIGIPFHIIRRSIIKNFSGVAFVSNSGGMAGTGNMRDGESLIVHEFSKSADRG